MEAISGGHSDSKLPAVTRHWREAWETEAGEGCNEQNGNMVRLCKGPLNSGLPQSRYLKNCVRAGPKPSRIDRQVSSSRPYGLLEHS